jgi:hypothetical protein
MLVGLGRERKEFRLVPEEAEGNSGLKEGKCETSIGKVVF